MFDNFLFAVPGSSCVDWLGFDGSRLFVRLKNWKEQQQTYDHAYTYPCSLDQFNRLLSADSIGKYYNDWFRFVYTAGHATFRELQFTYDTLHDLQDVETGLPKSAGAFQSLQFYSRITGETAFEEMTQLLAVVPAAYPGAVRIEAGARLNPALAGLFAVPLACSAIIENIQARVMAFKVGSMMCSLIAVEDYAPIHGTLKSFGSCLLHVPGILEV